MDSPAPQADRIQDVLGLSHPPVAIAFRDTPPRDVERVSQAEAAGCAYWRLAAEGRTFYTRAEDHTTCPLGAYTHGFGPDEGTARELEDLVDTMVGLGYISRLEITEMPRRSRPASVVVYSPLEDAPGEPDVVLIRGNPRQIMIVAEAARVADLAANGLVLGRPACTMIPQVLNSAAGTTSLGCVGNRIYTGLGEDELYYALPGVGLRAFTDRLEKIAHANQEMEAYHRGRAS